MAVATAASPSHHSRPGGGGGHQRSAHQQRPRPQQYIPPQSQTIREPPSMPNFQSLIPNANYQPQMGGAAQDQQNVPQITETDTQHNINNDGTLAGDTTTMDAGSLYLPQPQTVASTTSRTREGHIRIGMKWTLGQRIGAGNFGQVYIGHDIDGIQKYCIKMEKTNAKSPQLNREYRFYHMLRGHHGFPRVYWYGQVQKYNCLVMDLLGPSLDDLHGICSRRFSLKTTCLIALQLIDRFEVLHSKGLIYRDVKPENFLLGRRSSPQQHSEMVVFVVDMGLAKLYRDARTGEHLPEAFGQAVTGTARYMSINANFGNEQSRRDDMEALGHLLIFFMRSRLPWQGLKPGNAVKDHIRLIGQVKRDTAVSDLCDGLPEEFSLYISYCRHLDFYAKPDYEYLRELFIDLCERNQWRDDGIFDWTEREDEITRHSLHSLPKEPVRLGSQDSHINAGAAAAAAANKSANKNAKRSLPAAASNRANPSTPHEQSTNNNNNNFPEIQASASTPQMPTTNTGGAAAKKLKRGTIFGGGENAVSATPSVPNVQQATTARRATLAAKSLFGIGNSVTTTNQQQQGVADNKPSGVVAAFKRKASRHNTVIMQQQQAGSIAGGLSNVSQTGTITAAQQPGAVATDTTPAPLSTKQHRQSLSPQPGTRNAAGMSSSVVPSASNHSNRHRMPPNKRNTIVAGSSVDGGTSSSAPDTGGGGRSTTASVITGSNQQQQQPTQQQQLVGVNNKASDDSSIVFKFLCIRIRRKRNRTR